MIVAALVDSDPGTVALADAILRAAGRSLGSYMPANQERIVAEARRQIDSMTGRADDRRPD